MDYRDIQADQFSIVVRCTSDAGEVSGFGKIAVEAFQLFNPMLNVVSKHVGITVSKGENNAITGNATFELEKLDGICQTIERMQGLDPQATKFSRIEANTDFGGFKFAVFNMPGRGMYFSVTAEHSMAFVPLKQLPELVRLLRLAGRLHEENQAQTEGMTLIK